MSFSDHDGAAPESQSSLFAAPHETARTQPSPDSPDEAVHEEPLLRHRRTTDHGRSDAGTSAAEYVRETTREAPVHNRRRTQPAPRPRRVAVTKGRTHLGLLVRVVLFVLVLATVATLATVLYFRHVLRASLPEIDGSQAVPGLSAAVKVERNDHGVPSIRGNSIDDLLIAQGYVTAQDRLWQMDALRRHAAGELAEVLGSSFVDHDRQQRILQIRSAADRALPALPQDDRHQLELYARGVNRYIDTHADRLPVEFRVLHYTPAPWQPRDSVLVMFAMWQDLTTGFPVKLQREALTRHLPAALLTDLYPTGSFRDRPPTQQPEDLTTPKPSVLQIPLDSTQLGELVQPHDLLHRAHALSPLAGCDACRAGSNNWAVAASRSASGAPLLAGDMHLHLGVPGVWYEAALHAASANGQPLDVEGFTLPGLPFVVSGRNAHVAWSFTNMTADVQDVYVEHLRGTGDATEFQRADGTWESVQHHNEHIHVRGHSDVSIDVLSTTHAVGSSQIETPVISGLYPGEHRALSLAWTMYDPTAAALPLMSVNNAASGADLVNAFSTVGLPLNLVWADDGRHIGYHALGRIPVRGPADRHPRQLPSLDMDVPAIGPPADEESNPDSNPDTNPDAPENNPAHSDLQPAWQSAQPHLTLASFTPQPRLQPAAYVPPPARRRRRATRRAAGQRQPSHAAPRLAPVGPPPPPPIDYTIGGPLLDVPADALAPAAAWSGYVPYDQLPNIVDPASGLLATANARITADDFPYAIADNWADAYRVERIYRLLEHRSGLTPADMTAVQLDTTSALARFLAERLAYAIDHASKDALGNDGVRLHHAADILRRWDGNMTASSVGASLTDSFRAHAWPALLIPQIRAHDHLQATDHKAVDLAALYSWASSASALEVVLNHQPPRWLPAGAGTWDDFLTRTLEASLREDEAPHDLNRWTWETRHRITVTHPLLSRRFVGRLLAARVDPGPKFVPGDDTTVRASRGSFGASQRFVTDLISADATTATLPGGQSGNPASPWYLDQFSDWLHGTALPLPMSGAAAPHSLTLTP